MGVGEFWDSLKKMGLADLQVPPPAPDQQKIIIRDIMTYLMAYAHHLVDKSDPAKAELTTPGAMAKNALAYLDVLLAAPGVSDVVLVADVASWVPPPKRLEHAKRANHSEKHLKKLSELLVQYPEDKCVFSMHGVSVDGGPVAAFPLTLMTVRAFRRSIIKCVIGLLPEMVLALLPPNSQTKIVLDLDHKAPLVSVPEEKRSFQHDLTLANSLGEGDLKMAEHAVRLLCPNAYMLLQTTDSDTLIAMAPRLWSRLSTDDRWVCVWSSGTNPSTKSVELRSLYRVFAEPAEEKTSGLTAPQFVAIAILTGSDYFFKKSALHRVGSDTIVDSLVRACRLGQVPRDLDSLTDPAGFVKLVAIAHRAHCYRAARQKTIDPDARDRDEEDLKWETICMSNLHAPAARSNAKSATTKSPEYGDTVYVVPTEQRLLKRSFMPLENIVAGEGKEPAFFKTMVSPCATFVWNMRYLMEGSPPDDDVYFGQF